MSCYICNVFITCLHYFFHNHIRDVCEIKSEIASQTESSNIAKSKEEDYFNFCWKNYYKFLMIMKGIFKSG